VDAHICGLYKDFLKFCCDFWLLIHLSFHRNTLDLVTPNFLLEVHIRALLSTSGSFSAIESQCVMKYRGEEFVEMLTVMQCPRKFS